MINRQVQLAFHFVEIYTYSLASLRKNRVEMNNNVLFSLAVGFRCGRQDLLTCYKLFIQLCEVLHAHHLNHNSNPYIQVIT